MCTGSWMKLLNVVNGWWNQNLTHAAVSSDIESLPSIQIEYFIQGVNQTNIVKNRWVNLEIYYIPIT